MRLLEPAVALTDFALVIECACFAFLLTRYRAARLRLSFIALFLATGMAALFGGISHGFLGDTDTMTSQFVWEATLVSISLATLASWVAGARLALHERWRKIVVMLAAVAFVAEVAYVLFVDPSFAIGILNYAPAALFLLAAFGLTYRDRPAPVLLAGIFGLLLTFIAAAVQLTGIGLHPYYFDHNAFYHLIQGVALFLIFMAARGLVQSPSQ